MKVSTKFAFGNSVYGNTPIMLCSGIYWSVSHYLDPSHKYKGLVDEFSFKQRVKREIQ